MIKYRSISLNFLIIPILALWSATDASAQEFGDVVYDLSEYIAAGGGISIQHFTPSTGNLLPDSSAIRFSNPQFHLELRSLETRLALGYSSYSRFGKSGAALNLSAESRQDIPLLKGSLRSGIYLPICLSTNFIRAANLSSRTKDVNVVSLGVGSGLDARWLRRDFGLEVRCTGIFHFSTQSFSVDDGTSNLLSAEVLLLLPEEAVGRGVIVGYRYELQIWKMKKSDLNYRREINGPFVNVVF